MKKSKKIVNYDAQADVLYLGVKKGLEEEFVEVSPGLGVELNKKGEVIGVEILNASQFLKPVIKPLHKQMLATVPVAR